MHRDLIVAAVALLLAFQASAQEARRPPVGDPAAARLQAQIQQLGSEKTALEAENNRLKAQVAKLEKDAKGLATEKESLARRAGSAESKVSRAEAGQQSSLSRLDATEARLTEVVAKYKELAEQLRQVETERSQVAQQAARDGQALKVCARKNVELADIANEALDRYKDKGCFGALAQAEPFTGIKRAQIENAVGEYRQQVDSLKLPAGATPETPAP